jgi:tRNA(His) 5'-end guanylyltransferase
MKDALGDRMKRYYEDRTRIQVPRRTYTLIRIDGKAFHTYTKGLIRPFDQGLIDDMNETSKFLCKNIQGAKFAYCQSDEISILLTDFDDLSTDMWFDGNIQKMASVSASIATAKFNQLRHTRSIFHTSDGLEKGLSKLAMFDSRVFQIPSSIEVENYFIWRQQDATRNSIQSVAQSLYSSKALHGKKTDEMQEMIFAKGINWHDYDYRKKRGTVVAKVEEPHAGTIRNRWQAVETPIFTKDREFLRGLIPNMNQLNGTES